MALSVAKRLAVSAVFVVSTRFALIFGLAGRACTTGGQLFNLHAGLAHVAFAIIAQYVWHGLAYAALSFDAGVALVSLVSTLVLGLAPRWRPLLTFGAWLAPLALAALGVSLSTPHQLCILH